MKKAMEDLAIQVEKLLDQGHFEVTRGQIQHHVPKLDLSGVTLLLYLCVASIGGAIGLATGMVGPGLPVADALGQSSKDDYAANNSRS